MPATEKRKWFEILAVFFTGGLKYVLMDWLELRIFYITLVCLFWSIYIVRRYKVQPDVLKSWGFRKERFKAAFLFLLPFAILMGTVIIWYGIRYNAEMFNLNLIPVFLLYPAWGTIQQFMMIALIAGNLQSISTLNLSTNQITILIAVLFSIAHFPDLTLVGFTFFMELLFLLAYFRYRNLWPLGLFHGWIGSLLLYLVRGRDLWNELWSVF